MAYNVLIVNDSQTMRKVIRKTVTLSGFDLGECWEAGNGQEALEAVRSRFVDLILTDLNMPVMNGLELRAELAKDEVYQNIPVVLITREGGEKTLEETTDSTAGPGIVLDFNADGQRVRLDLRFDTVSGKKWSVL